MRVAFGAACALAAVIPLAGPWLDRESLPPFPGWPATLEGRPLTPRPLAAREARFAAGFPGRWAAFADGERTLLVRWVARPTRQLHPAADCYRGAGYQVEPAPVRRDGGGRFWGCFTASRGGHALRVCERIEDAAGAGFVDASEWYWAASLGRSRGPWWAYTRAEPKR